MTNTNGKSHVGFPRPTLVQRAQGVFGALAVVTMLYCLGLPGAIVAQTKAAMTQSLGSQSSQTSMIQRAIRTTILLLNPIAWRNAIVAHGLPFLLDQSDKNGGELKRETIEPYAKGKTLEVGAGTGLSVKYYDADKITDLYLIEPMTELHAALRKSIAAVPGLANKTHIVPCGIEARQELTKHGVTEKSFDTITLVQVLCSIPTPEKHLAFLQSLLKPGGQLLMFEHIVSDDGTTARLQHIWNPVWTRLSGGCNVNRDSAARVASLGGWSHIDITRPADESRGDFYTHALGRFVKA